MNAFGFLILLLVVVTPIAWFASEFQDRRWLRLSLGTAAIMLSFGVAYVVASLQILQDNVWFGNASKLLIDTSIEEMEAGNQEDVLTAWKQLQKKYSPTYENRARYDRLVTRLLLSCALGSARVPECKTWSCSVIEGVITLSLTVEVEKEDDGRWIAEVCELAGVLAYGRSPQEAIENARALAFRVIADQLQHGEGVVIPLQVQ